jgi:hypothetical protein
MAHFGTVWRTVRHLKAEQIVGRVRFRLRRPSVDAGASAPARRALTGTWMPPAQREPSLVGPRRLRLLNVEQDIDRCGWDDPQIEKLWRYNLHYFDDLNARDARARAAAQRALVSAWIAGNPVTAGTGWEPYPVSLRIVNWIKWFASGEPPQPDWIHSLALQARWLQARLETHLLGNHLFANAKALVFAGLFFAGPEAERWLHGGQQILAQQLPEQILPDGGQFERSTMYHALALEDVLDLINVVRAFPSPHSSRLAPVLNQTASRMLFWLRCMVHPDRTLGLFNDAAEGVAPDLDELESYAARLGVTAANPAQDSHEYLRDSGYIRVARGRALALLDVAPVGPDYLPAHAHADTLSFELSLGPQRVIVNGGTSAYGAGAQRERERGTAAHSTVEVAGCDSSEVWSGFRVGRRARPSQPVFGDSRVCCAHDGYRFLAGRPLHNRCWQFGAASLTVEDSVTQPRFPAVARYILAPGLTLASTAAGRWDVLRGENLIARVEATQGSGSVTRAAHAPRFGVSVPVECLAIALSDGRAATVWSWLP